MLEVKNIYKSFGENQVLKGVNFSVEKGDVIAVLVSSGSGKTTLLTCISFPQGYHPGHQKGDPSAAHEDGLRVPEL